VKREILVAVELVDIFRTPISDILVEREKNILSILQKKWSGIVYKKNVT